MREAVRRAIAISALSAALLVTLAQSELGIGSRISFDLVARYAAGEVTAQGESPYDDEVLFDAERSLGSHRLVPMYDAPPVAAAFRVLSVVPLRVVAFVVGVLSLAACAVLVRAVMGGSAPALWVVGSIALLAFSPARHALHLGQTDLIVLAAVVLFARAQPVLAIGKPQTAGLTAIALFGEGARERVGRAALVAAAGSLAVVVGTAILAPSATWPDWIAHLDTRDQGARWSWLLLVVAALGCAVIAHAVRRDQRLRGLDLVSAVGAATGLLAVMGGWNPQWFLAQALPLGALLVAFRAGTVAPRPHERWLLVLACGLAAGDSYVVFSFNIRLWIPVAILACVGVALVALREVPLGAAVAVIAINAAATAAPLSKADRAALPMLVSVILLHLVLELRPQAATATTARPPASVIARPSQPPLPGTTR